MTTDPVQVNEDAVGAADSLQHHRPSGDPHEGHDAHEDHADHSTHAGHSPDMFRDRFWLSLALSIPVVLRSGMVREWMEDLLGFATPTLTGSDLISPILGTVIFL